MSLRTFTLAALAAATLPVAPAAAAPDRSGETPLAADGDKYTWTTADNFGAVYGTPVADSAPHCTPIFACDQTLIQVGEHPDTPLDLQIDIVGTGQDLGGNNTLKDVDVHVYQSDKDGTQGDMLMESTSANPAETVYLADAAPGYYLVLVDWFTGYGHVDGTAKLVPTPPVEEEEDF